LCEITKYYASPVEPSAIAAVKPVSAPLVRAIRLDAHKMAQRLLKRRSRRLQRAVVQRAAWSADHQHAKSPASPRPGRTNGTFVPQKEPNSFFALATSAPAEASTRASSYNRRVRLGHRLRFAGISEKWRQIEKKLENLPAKKKVVICLSVNLHGEIGHLTTPLAACEG